MLWARLVRGSSTSENAVTPRAASASTMLPCAGRLQRKLIEAAPACSSATSSSEAAGPITPRQQSSAKHLSVALDSHASLAICVVGKACLLARACLHNHLETRMRLV